MIEIEIDGIKLTVPKDSMIIQAADNAGINIPRFCYHKKLSIAANCRMCLIEVEKVGKPLPACATPVSEGMRVFTRSARAIEAQRAVMEFLLINHPLDCPICDQGGECELQDISMQYGSDSSRYAEGKRAVSDENLGPLIATDMTRCIQCTRCVRFGKEIAGVRELGTMGRGELMEIKTYVKHTLASELSGNIIDLCPVGALTSKPFRFTARAWELNQASSIAPHDAVGSNVYVHTRRGKVMRVVPQENENVNENWISDRDRFSYLGIYSTERLERPLMKVHGEWYESDWASALDKVVSRLNEVIHTHGSDQIAALASPSSTLEECYLLQKFWRGIGSPHMDHRIHITDFSDQANAAFYPGFNTSLSELEQKDAVLLIGSNLHHEQPLVGHRLRKASLQGAKMMVINPVDFSLNFVVAEKIIVHPYQMVEELAAIIKVLAGEHVALPTDFMQHFSHINADDKHIAIARHLQASKQGYVLLGAEALNHPQSSLLHWLARCIAALINAPCGELTEGANVAGAWQAGLLPHRGAAGAEIETPGLDAQKMFKTPLKSYLLMGIDPALDCANPQRVLASLKQSEFVVAISPFKSSYLMEVADVILPAATFAETSGTFVNGEGRWQSFSGSVPPLFEARPIWKILRVLGNFFNLEGFDYESSEEVRDELQSLATQKSIRDVATQIPDPFCCTEKLSRFPLTRIAEWPIYRGDSLVRHATALQQLPTQKPAGAYINQEMAKKLGFVEGDLAKVAQNEGSAELLVFIDLAIPDDCVFVPAGYEETAMLGENFGEIRLNHV